MNYAAYLESRTHEARIRNDALVSELSKDLLHTFEVKSLENAERGMTSCNLKLNTTSNICLERLESLPTDSFTIIRRKLMQKINTRLKNDKFVMSNFYISKPNRKTRKCNISLFAAWKASNTNVTVNTSNVSCKCPICLDIKPVITLVPCGHLICNQCNDHDRIDAHTKPCPVCRGNVEGWQPIFEA